MVQAFKLILSIKHWHLFKIDNLEEFESNLSLNRSPLRGLDILPILTWDHTKT